MIMQRVRAARGEDGMTLVELIVSSMLTVFMMTLVGTLFIRSMDANAAVRATTVTTNEARIQFDEIQRAIRLAVETDVRVGTAPAVVPADGRGDVLIVKTRLNEGDVANASTWRCMGWYVDSAGNLRGVKDTTIATGTPQTALDPATWPVISPGVTAIAPRSPFLAHDPDVDVEAWYPGSVGVNLRFEVTDANVPVHVETTVAPRRQLQLDGETPGGQRCPQP
jgi:type II secretory pathway pseudopilin PulG